MNFDDYQNSALCTAIYPQETALEYTTLGLVGEAGEVANKVKKILRRDVRRDNDAFINEIAMELGDVLWYVACLASELDLKLDDIAIKNLLKLSSRQKRDVLRGTGDKR